MAETDPNLAFINELEPIAGQYLERHLGRAKEWFPHQLVPYGRGHDFEPGEEWNENMSAFDGPVRDALVLNLLTEDNLPYYFHRIEGMFGSDNSWGTWNRRWTAEEMRHSIVIRDWLTVTRAVDPVALERARMAQVSTGIVPQPGNPWDGVVYVTLQELATRISHLNTGKRLESKDPAGYEVMKRVAADENFHFLFYRDVGTAALQLNASRMVLAIERQVVDFEMPGTGVVDYSRLARSISAAGIYDLQIHHDDILVPVLLRHWKLESLEGLSPEAEKAREHIMNYIGRLGRIATRMLDRKARKAEQVVGADVN